MSKINFIGAGGGGGGGAGAGGVSSINGESGVITLAGASGVTINTDGTSLSVNGGDLLPRDGSRSMLGNIVPDASGAHSLGEPSLPFSSGAMDKVIIQEITLRTFEDQLLIRQTDETDYALIRGRYGDQTLDIMVIDKIFKISTEAMVGFTASTTANNQDPETSISWASSGLLKLGQGNTISAANRNGSIVGASGHFTSGYFEDDVFAESGRFPSGIVMTAPNGSGWRLTLDNDGILSTEGPFVL